VLLLLLSLVPVAAAQYGHPLKGQWSGQWEHGGESTRLLLDLHWDGKAVSGVINPGGEEAAVTSVSIDYSDVTAWQVRLEASRAGASGAAARNVVEGTLENLGAYNRVFRGTWTEGGRSGPFLVTRN
jgi:hypothetical protein